MKLTDNIMYICVLSVQLLLPFHCCNCICQFANKWICYVIRKGNKSGLFYSSLGPRGTV